MAKRAKAEIKIPEYCQLSEDYGARVGSLRALFPKIVEGVKADMDKGADVESIKGRLGSYYLAGYGRDLPHQVREWIAMDKKAFKALGSEKKDANTARQLASKARFNYVDGVIKAAAPISPQGDKTEGDEGEAEATEADKAARIEEARKAYAKACERAEAQLKKVRQTLQDLGADIIGEGVITACFIPMRGPMGGAPDKA